MLTTIENKKWQLTIACNGSVQYQQHCEEVAVATVSDEQQVVVATIIVNWQQDKKRATKAAINRHQQHGNGCYHTRFRDRTHSTTPVTHLVTWYPMA